MKFPGSVDADCGEVQSSSEDFERLSRGIQSQRRNLPNRKRISEHVLFDRNAPAADSPPLDNPDVMRRVRLKLDWLGVALLG